MNKINERMFATGSNETEFEAENNDEMELTGPFDPNDIDVDISVVNLGLLLEQLEYEEIDLKPEFQRSSDVWTPEQKSRLIESALLGLPLPSFYFSEDPATNKLMIVDGLQRLSALKDFWLSKKLRLVGLQFLTQLEGKGVDELDRTQIRRIKSLKVTLNTLRKSTPAKVKFVIFQRVNTAGVPLTAQEMRNALYQGRATELLKRMVQANSFQQATDSRVTERRMADTDLANRFLAFFLRKNKYAGELDPFMADTLEVVNNMAQKDVDDIFQTFDTSMTLCFQLLGKNAFRRPDPKKPCCYLRTNKSVFDVLSVSIAWLTPQEQQQLTERKTDFEKGMQLLYNDSDFLRSVTTGTAKVPQVDMRYAKVKDLINKTLAK